MWPAADTQRGPGFPSHGMDLLVVVPCRHVIDGMASVVTSA